MMTQVRTRFALDPQSVSLFEAPLASMSDIEVSHQSLLIFSFFHDFQAVEKGGWQYLTYAIVYGISVEVLRFAKSIFHSTVCKGLTKWKEAEMCLCQDRLLWVVAENLPKGGAIYWQYATSKRVCLEEESYRSVLVGQEASAKLKPGNNYLFIVKANSLPPLATKGMVIAVERFLDERMKFACVNLASSDEDDDVEEEEDAGEDE